MKKSASVLVLLFCGALFFAEDALMSGLDAYARSDWSNAILSFRKAISGGRSGAEPWYWLIMSELSTESYPAALRDIDAFSAGFPSDSRIPDAMYQKGRVLYLTGRYEESIATLYQYLMKWPEHPMIASAYYWIGESLFACGRYEEARTVFGVVLGKYPQAAKREAAAYRIALINRTGREDELLALLKSSHEESLKIIEEYQRREKTYEQAITAYQKRISDMMKDSRLGDLEKQLGDEKNRNAELSERIAALEKANAELTAQVSKKPVAADATTLTDDLLSDDADARLKAIEALKKKAADVQRKYDQSSGTEEVGQ